MDDLRIGLVGCGRLAERGYVPAARRARGVTLAAVADLDPARGRSIAAGLPAFASLHELLAGTTVDAVVIATPPSAHLPDARTAAEAGKPTLVEKPPAAHAGEARQLAALAPPPWIGFNRRFLLGLAQAREAIVADAVTLELQLRYPRAAWQSYIPGPDALLDAGVHLVDLARWLTGAEVRRARAPVLTPERALVELDLGPVRARVECAVDQPHRELVEARDETGKLVHRYADGGPWRALRRRVRSPGEDNPFVNSLARQLEDFARAVREGAGRLATAADGVRAMEVLEGARRSAEQGGSWYTLPS